jgi:hypothetical protein
MLAQGVAHPYLSLFCMNTEGTGAASLKSRRNLLRASQIVGASG